MIEVVAITKRVGSNGSNRRGLPVLDGLSLVVRPGELVTIFGPNGCGKSTLLNILAGTVAPDSGRIVVQEPRNTGRAVGYVFQNYGDTLLPWRTVRGNVSFPLELRKLEASAIAVAVERCLERFHLLEHADKYVYELSGGLKQLVSIARATVYKPQLLLLDEPFSALDYSISRSLWVQFREFWMQEKVSTVFVSHNVDEAVFLGNRVYVLSPRPAKVVEEVIVPFGPERTLDILSSSAFFSARSSVLKAFGHTR